MCIHMNVQKQAETGLKRCCERIAYPNLQQFQVTSWSLRSHFGSRNFSSVFPEIGIHNTPGKTSS